MVQFVIDANAVWLIHSNIAHFQNILRGELTVVQRRTVEQLLADQTARLEGMARSNLGI